ncbi:MAG: hypothetical protein HOE90_14200 [Bacteriovoracaceae bacterium]|nr:hypothetical protein [Bacteriovoracaceae bacterium]
MWYVNAGLHSLKLLALGVVLCSCLPFSNDGASKRKNDNSHQTNSESSLNSGYGRVLTDNPIVLSGYDWTLPAGVSLAQFLISDQDFISNTGTLSSSCTGSSYTIQNCYKVLQTNTSTPLYPLNGRWAYSPDTENSKWLQTHTMGHMNKGVDNFLAALSYSYGASQSGLTASSYASSIPTTLYSGYGFWYDQKQLIAYSEGYSGDNAFFTPSTFTVTFGTSVETPGLKFATDPSVVYHEFGHGYVQIMSNMRNVVDSSITERVDFGIRMYDEPGAINEGIADYFSYIMNDRTHVGEWALGRFFNLSRPLIESDSRHVSGINSDPDKRLSYPTYVRYDPYYNENPIEDLHLTGMIASHYFVALTGDLQSYCNKDLSGAQKDVVYMITESLSEIGDLTTKDSDVTGIYPYSTYSNHVNLNTDSASAKLWATVIRPGGFRRFFQTFGKNVLARFGSCMTQDLIEQRLDMYGLLLFKTFNEDGNGYDFAGSVSYGNDGTINAVSAVNRIYTKLIAKELIELPTDGTTQAYIVDEQQSVYDFVTTLKASGRITNISSLIPGDLSYNNGNSKPSPGEVFGMAINLKNKSNSDMAGVTILANDWDHARYESGEFKMCNTLGDSFPLTSENAATVDAAIPAVDGECGYVTKENGAQVNEVTEVLAPVCFALSRETSDTKWVDQNKFRSSQGLDTSECLGGSSSTSDCYLRAIDGANFSVYPVISASKTFGETLEEEEDAGVSLKGNHVILFELSPWTPPGTTFNCRLRARFTNCDDCWHDPNQADNDDYLDYQYSGADPYKIINFQFTVID